MLTFGVESKDGKRKSWKGTTEWLLSIDSWKIYHVHDKNEFISIYSAFMGEKYVFVITLMVEWLNG